MTIGSLVKTFAISHFWDHVPIHLVGCRVDFEVYDAMQSVIASGSSYQTCLDPLPADPLGTVNREDEQVRSLLAKTCGVRESLGVAPMPPGRHESSCGEV